RELGDGGDIAGRLGCVANVHAFGNPPQALRDRRLCKHTHRHLQCVADGDYMDRVQVILDGAPLLEGDLAVVWAQHLHARTDRCEVRRSLRDEQRKEPAPARRATQLTVELEKIVVAHVPGPYPFDGCYAACTRTDTTIRGCAS